MTMRTEPSSTVDSAVAPWRDPALPVAQRVKDLLARMTIEEKLAQLAGIWVGTGQDAQAGPNGDSQDAVAPMQGEFADDTPVDELIRDGIGQLTRVLGTVPIAPRAGAEALAALQLRVMAASRFGIPAIAHEECLAGFTTWGATGFPAPPSWGASFDAEAVREMGAAIGASMRAVGVHQGLAPVLDVVRDSRWGRVEETIGEDPYLVGIIGTAYVQGLQSAGVIATLKHFAGYSASRAGRNLAPVDIGPRALADVLLPPFEMAIREGGARSVMASYVSLDGVPVHADPEVLTTLLRDELGFTGTVVADYFGVSFLEKLHGVAGSLGEAAALALQAGVDVELPHRRCYGAPLAAAVLAGDVGEDVVDLAAARVLTHKFELGLLDPDWSPGPGPSASPGQAHAAEASTGGSEADSIDLDPPAYRDLARRLAEESVVLLANDGGVLPIAQGAGPARRLAVIGPLAEDPLAFFGCYSFPRHVGYRYPGHGSGLPEQSILGALRAEFPAAEITAAQGCSVRSADRDGFAAAVSTAASADLVVAVLGDEAGLFGRGSSGEGCDTPDLRLPGVQQELLDALVATGVPVVLVLVVGRPYALGGAAARLGAAVVSFFPGQGGAAAIAGVLSGRVTPSGKLPVEVPAHSGGQPAPYLRPPLAGPTDVSALDPTPLYAFGHGLSYTSFEYSKLSIDPACLAIQTDGAADITCTVRNTGQQPGAEVVQLYLGDPVAEVVRPVRFLAGFARVPLAPGESRRITFGLHADRTAFCGRSGERIVEPGHIDVQIGSSSADVRLAGSLMLQGPRRVVGPDRVLTTPVIVD
ncbi:MAG TPA: glycoside hydrolase family 3 N-terminal domain-containing protein [Streptosporangiaceae bacterium]